MSIASSGPYDGSAPTCADGQDGRAFAVLGQAPGRRLPPGRRPHRLHHGLNRQSARQKRGDPRAHSSMPPHHDQVSPLVPHGSLVSIAVDGPRCPGRPIIQPSVPTTGCPQGMLHRKREPAVVDEPSVHTLNNQRQVFYILKRHAAEHPVHALGGQIDILLSAEARCVALASPPPYLDGPAGRRCRAAPPRGRGSTGLHGAAPHQRPSSADIRPHPGHRA